MAKKRFKVYLDLESFAKAEGETEELNKKFQTTGFKPKSKTEKTEQGINVTFKKGYDKDNN